MLAHYGRDSIPVIYFPIDDFKTPKPRDVNFVSRLVDKIEELLSKGLNVVIHCHAGNKKLRNVGKVGRYWKNWVVDFLVGKTIFGAFWNVGSA